MLQGFIFSAISTLVGIALFFSLKACVKPSKDSWKYKPRQDCAKLLIEISDKERYERLKWAYEKTGRCPL